MLKKMIKDGWRRRWPATAMAMAGGMLLATAALPQAARAASKPIVLGMTTPLSEPGDARSGHAIQKAVNLWADQVNQAGGILGRKVEIKAFDTQGKPAVGAQAARRAIINAHVSAIVGDWSSSVTLAEMRMARRYNTPLLAFYSWNDKVTGLNYPQVFRIGPYNSLIARDMVPFVKHQGYKRVALLAEDTAYGAGFAKAFTRDVKGTGVKLDVVKFPPQAQDLTAQLSKIKQFKPDAMIIETVYAASNLAIKQAREVGLNTQIIAGWDWPTLSDFWPTVGKSGVGVIYASFKGPDSQLTAVGKRFEKAYEKRYKQSPAIFQYFLYDTLNAVKAAIIKAGSAKPAALVKTLPTVSFEGTTGHITFAHKKGTVDFNQWGHVSMFFKQMTKQGQSGAQAKLVYSTH